MRNPLAGDLDHVLARTSGLWTELRGARVFMTGGTGFFGCWLLETFLWANDHLGLGASVVVLTRDSSAFSRKAPHLAHHPAVRLHEGDVRTFELADGSFSHLVHAATDARPVPGLRDRLLVFDTIVDGTRRTLEFARRARVRRFLMTSTGAVYGRQPAEMERMPEDYAGGPDVVNPALTGAEAKRVAEMLCAVYADANLQPTIARCFAFVGPYLPLDAHFAVGNFIRDALNGGPIRISGDGTPRRSYWYAADLAVWLWTILLRGQSTRPYNVGSEEAISIRELAQAVALRFNPAPVVSMAQTAPAGALTERYIPSTARARNDLGVTMTVNLEDALTRTIDWQLGRAASIHVDN